MDMDTGRDSEVPLIDTRRGGKAAFVVFATCMVCVRGLWDVTKGVKRSVKKRVKRGVKRGP
jgi:hypothetical protein